MPFERGHGPAVSAAVVEDCGVSIYAVQPRQVQRVRERLGRCGGVPVGDLTVKIGHGGSLHRCASAGRRWSPCHGLGPFDQQTLLEAGAACSRLASGCATVAVVDSLRVAVDNLGLRLPSPLVQLRDDRLDVRGVALYLKQDDLIHTDMPGNKWRKLKYNIVAAREQGASTLLTFGGAYSNHIRAVAAAADHFGFRSIGVIRGERHNPLNEVLRFSEDHGMTLIYMDRATYREKSSREALAELHARFGEFFLIPEGGSNDHALRGCAELVEEIDIDFDIICCPCGTGGTLAGIASGLREAQRAIGFSALKGGRFLNDDVVRLQKSALGSATQNWSIEQDFHFGGFGKKNSALASFIQEFEREHHIRLDWVYVAKMMSGLFSLIENGRFNCGSTVIAVVTG